MTKRTVVINCLIALNYGCGLALYFTHKGIDNRSQRIQVIPPQVKFGHQLMAHSLPKLKGLGSALLRFIFVFLVEITQRRKFHTPSPLAIDAS
jgi:hypothetical protein